MLGATLPGPRSEAAQKLAPAFPLHLTEAGRILELELACDIHGVLQPHGYPEKFTSPVEHVGHWCES